jgi:hypothetical protein
MDDRDAQRQLLRRTFLGQASLSLGCAALASLLERDGVAAMSAAEPTVDVSRWPGAVRPLHVPAQAKRVIFLYMSGGPSQLETFDYKPKLAELDGQPMPPSYTQGQPIAQLQGQELRCLRPLAKFRKYGASGQEISDFLPHIAGSADEICIIRSMVTEQINHDPAHTFMNTGSAIAGRPSMGSWIWYGLGSESENLPGFVVLTSRGGRNPQPISSRQWSSGFLPGRFQGVEFQSRGDAVHYVSNPPGVGVTQQRDVVRAVQGLNRLHRQTTGNPEIATRIAQYELAFRMQASVPELMDVSNEPQHILDMYGAKPGDGSFASNCLLARRLAERGVRFIQLYHRGWDHHGDLVRYMTICCRLCDRPTAALIRDLKQRGMLEDTLVIWGGEFGRTPMFQGKGAEPGRDHHIKGFSMFLAGAGIRRGFTYGETDELGYNAVTDVVHVRDLHATMLYLLGIDHHRLNFRFQGADFRLTGVLPAQVVHSILA